MRRGVVNEVPDFYNNEIASVIISVYNAGKYLEKAMESALHQTYQNLEIVVVDDCSTDNSREIIAEYVQNNKNIIYHLQEKNEGAAVTRNKALDLASGRYVAFLDSDDLWYPDKITKQIALMQEKKVGFCFTAFEIINENDEVIKGKRAFKEKINYQFLLRHTILNTSSVVIDRNKTGNFHMPLLRAGQDYATWLKLMRSGLEGYGVNKVLVKYRKRSDSISANKIKSAPRMWIVQTKYEGINPFLATFNFICFAFHAIKKHYF